MGSDAIASTKQGRCHKCHHCCQRDQMGPVGHRTSQYHHADDGHHHNMGGECWQEMDPIIVGLGPLT
eukprot:2944770-Karenia_brevis.AAC.1